MSRSRAAPLQGTTSNGKCILPFKTGAFLAGAPVQPVIIKYGPDRVSPAWDSVGALWHVFLLLANPFHSVTARQVAPHHHEVSVIARMHTVLILAHPHPPLCAC